MKMKPAITMTTTILVSVLAAGLASAQSPSIIQNARATMNGVSNRETAASNEALGIHQSAPAAASAKHAPAGTPAPARSSAVAVKSEPGPKHTGGAKQVSAAVVRHHEHKRSGVIVGGVVAGEVAGVAPAAAPQQQEDDLSANGGASNGASGGGEGEFAAGEQQVVPDAKYAANGRRDPFISPVVSHAGGSGCSTGKKCLEIGAINLRGVVHSESGFIAVVSNNMNKAYFLRENDPVFNGYVVKITGDSIVFQETLQDRLGKTFTREVVKKITTPAV